MKKIRIYLLVTAIIAILLLVKFLFFPTEKPKEAKGAGKDGKKPASLVSVFVVGAEKLQDKLQASGTIVANEEAELKVEASGRIIYLNLPEGKTVNKGTLLLKVNDADLRAQLDKIRAQLKLASDAEIRQRRLLQMEGASQQEYDITLSNLQSLKADSAYLQAQIAKTELYAPFNGVISIRTVSNGSYITSATPVGKIIEIDPVKIDFSVPEKYSSLFKEGNVVDFVTESSPQHFTGKIIVKDPIIDLANRSIRYRAISRNPKRQLLPGAFVKVELALNDKSNSLFVPTEAIVPVLKGKKVFVIKEGVAEEKIVETGLRTEDHVQILSGLSIGDSVVVNGNYQLKKGAAVKVMKQPKANR